MATWPSLAVPATLAGKGLRGCTGAPPVFSGWKDPSSSARARVELRSRAPPLPCPPTVTRPSLVDPATTVGKVLRGSTYAAAAVVEAAEAAEVVEALVPGPSKETSSSAPARVEPRNKVSLYRSPQTATRLSLAGPPITMVTQQANKFGGAGASGAAQQGRSVSLSSDGNTAIVGGPGDNSGQGAAWVYTRSGGVWTQQGNKLVGTGASGAAQQGVSVSLSVDGNTAIVGGLDDNGGAGAAWVYVTTLTAPPLVMIGQLPPATIGLPYSQTLTASGGTPPYVWSVVSGALPDGIALSPNAGVLSGTPTAPGSFTFAVGVSDSTTPTQLTATKTLTLTVDSALGPLAMTSPLPPATIGLPYSQTLTASGGTPPYVWSVVSGAPPNGIALSPSAGVLSGTPTLSGTVTFTVMVTNSTAIGAQTAIERFDLTVE